MTLGGSQRNTGDKYWTEFFIWVKWSPAQRKIFVSYFLFNVTSVVSRSTCSLLCDVRGQAERGCTNPPKQCISLPTVGEEDIFSSIWFSQVHVYWNKNRSPIRREKLILSIAWLSSAVREKEEQRGRRERGENRRGWRGERKREMERAEERKGEREIRREGERFLNFSTLLYCISLGDNSSLQ